MVPLVVVQNCEQYYHGFYVIRAKKEQGQNIQELSNYSVKQSRQ